MMSSEGWQPLREIMKRLLEGNEKRSSERTEVFIKVEEILYKVQLMKRGEGQYNPITMSYNENGTDKKRRNAHPWVFRGTASAPFVSAQGLGAHGNSLSPHPRPLQVQSHGTSTALGILPQICWSRRSPATPPLREECQQH